MITAQGRARLVIRSLSHHEGLLIAYLPEFIIGRNPIILLDRNGLLQ